MRHHDVDQTPESAIQPVYDNLASNGGLFVGNPHPLVDNEKISLTSENSKYFKYKNELSNAPKNGFKSSFENNYANEVDFQSSKYMKRNDDSRETEQENMEEGKARTYFFKKKIPLQFKKYALRKLRPSDQNDIKDILFAGLEKQHFQRRSESNLPIIKYDRLFHPDLLQNTDVDKNQIPKLHFRIPEMGIDTSGGESNEESITHSIGIGPLTESNKKEDTYDTITESETSVRDNNEPGNHDDNTYTRQAVDDKLSDEVIFMNELMNNLEKCQHISNAVNTDDDFNGLWWGPRLGKRGEMGGKHDRNCLTMRNVARRREVIN